MPKARVLIVDDHQLTRAALSGIVRLDPNLQVVGHSDNGGVALQAIALFNPDVVCLDVLMPGMDGLEVLQRVRADHPAIRVVMITAEATADVRQKATDLGAHGFVVKPFNGKDVLAAINAALRADGHSAVAPN